MDEIKLKQVGNSLISELERKYRDYVTAIELEKSNLIKKISEIQYIAKNTEGAIKSSGMNSLDRINDKTSSGITDIHAESQKAIATMNSISIKYSKEFSAKYESMIAEVISSMNSALNSVGLERKRALDEISKELNSALKKINDAKNRAIEEIREEKEKEDPEPEPEPEPEQQPEQLEQQPEQLEQEEV